MAQAHQDSGFLEFEKGFVAMTLFDERIREVERQCFRLWVFLFVLFVGMVFLCVAIMRLERTVRTEATERISR